ncbi:tyrosine-type recombinase/integrase [Helicobacter trogontum]|uniref:Site-specific integrase n=1 Tax=Helicobacter trogontum TaxID=50960 RepID=A0A4U8SES2_9HELI|nr:site-specific integrase [Helicobacter trogontum]TLD84653.1 site-specific integrase [Helicobacter trogontum]
MKTYKHAKVRNNSQFIQIEACINNVRYRFSTKLLVTKENMDYVEFNYKELIEQYKNQKNIEANKDDPYLLSNYGYQVLELEKATCKESTYIRYYNVFKKHIVSAIGSMLISDFSPKIMKEVFVNKFSHLSFANRNIGMTVLKKIFNHAITDEIYTKANPMICIKRTKNHQITYRNKPFELHEVMQIINYIDKDELMDDRMNIYFKIALFTGMRVNEILALKYEDIDLERKIIHVYKTLSNAKITTTKTQSGTREVEIIDALQPSLKEIKQTEEIGYIFVNRNNKFMSKQHVAKQFKEILTKLHLENRTLYSTRHTFASLSLSYGEDLLWIANMLGHKDVSTTCKSYAKYIKTNKKRATFFNTNNKHRKVG